MSVMYTIFSSETDGAGATIIFSDGTIQQISEKGINYARVVNILTTTPADQIDEENLKELLIPALGVGKNLTRLSERVTFDGENILFDGDVVADAIAEHILRIVNEGGNSDSYAALVAFMEKLYTNPSETARNSLYDFIVRYNITIDPDGDFYAYKGVKADNGSVWEGFGIVDGVSMNGSLPNKPGSILEIPRSKVNADNAIGCGTGLHAGTYSYAQGWARGMLLLVKINPRDVVSVPTCSAYQKIRTCRYKVISQTVHQTVATTYSTQVQTGLNTINNLTQMTQNGQSVPVTFTYTRGNGKIVEVEMTVTEVRKNSNLEEIIMGKNSDGESRTYRAAYITNLEIAPTAQVQSKVGVTSAQSDDEAVLREGIANGETVVIDFNYTTVNGESRTLANFEARKIEKAGWRQNELLIGEREDGETRSYRLDLITDLVVQEDEDNEDTSIPSWAKTAIGTAVTNVADTVESLKSLVQQGNSVDVSFDYTTVTGEKRTLCNFVADDIVGNGATALVKGEREDGETRRYRLDRITNVVVHDIF